MGTVENPYRVEAYCSICGEKFLARYNLGLRQKSCTPPSHVCKKSVKTLTSGRKKVIPCTENCCRSQYVLGAAIRAMDGAIDPDKLLTRDELDRLIKRSRKLEDPQGICIRFIANTGVRVSEALMVRRDLVTLAPPARVMVPTLKRKGRPIRTVFIHNEAFAKEISEYAKAKGGLYLFQDIPKRRVQYWFKKLMNRLGIKKSTGIHILRHTYASQLVAAGANFNFVRQQLGWSSLEMAKIYVHTSDEELERIGKGMK